MSPPAIIPPVLRYQRLSLYGSILISIGTCLFITCLKKQMKNKLPLSIQSSLPALALLLSPPFWWDSPRELSLPAGSPAPTLSCRPSSSLHSSQTVPVKVTRDLHFSNHEAASPSPSSLGSAGFLIVHPSLFSKYLLIWLPRHHTRFSYHCVIPPWDGLYVLTCSRAQSLPLFPTLT